MGWIRIEAQANITLSERKQTSDWSLFAREYVELQKEVKQMTTAEIVVGATSGREVDWHSLDWAKFHQTAKRLQMRIAKATSVVLRS